MFVRNIFWSQPDHRPRAIWRLALQTGLMVVIFLLIGATGRYLTEWLGFSWRRLGPALDMVYSTYALIAVITSVIIAGFVLDRRKFSSFGFRINRSWGLDFFFGLALGAGLIALIFVVELIPGWITVNGFIRQARNQPFLIGMIGWLMVFVAVGVYEETLSRGYHLRNLAEGLSIIPFGRKAAVVLAWILSSVIFGLAHNSNPNASIVSTLFLCIAGLQLGLGYILTGELSIPIGLHIAWNFFQGPVFGFPVSGIASGPSIVYIEQGGPEIWTGGSFGPEAGLLGLATNFIGMGLIMLWVRWRYNRVELCSQLAEYQKPGILVQPADNS